MTLDDAKDMFNAYDEGKIPLDSIWFDYSYMSRMQEDDFSVNSTTFSGIKPYKQYLDIHHVKMVVSVPPGLKSVT